MKWTSSGEVTVTSNVTGLKQIFTNASFQRVNGINYGDDGDNDYQIKLLFTEPATKIVVEMLFNFTNSNPDGLLKTDIATDLGNHADLGQFTLVLE